MIRIRIRMSFIGQVCFHIQVICYSDRSSTVQQNDSDRTGHRQQKDNIQIGNVQYGKNTIYNTDNYVWTGLTLCKLKWKNKYVWRINNCIIVLCVPRLMSCSWDGLLGERNCFCVWSFWCAGLCRLDWLGCQQMLSKKFMLLHVIFSKFKN